MSADKPAMKWVELFIEHLPHARALGIELVSYDATGRCVLKQPWREDLVGDPVTGVVHGGVITALLDTLGAACVIAKNARTQATLDLRIDYLRPALPRQGLFGDAECHRVTRHIAFVRGICHQGDLEKPVANLTATFILREPRHVREARKAQEEARQQAREPPEEPGQ